MTLALRARSSAASRPSRPAGVEPGFPPPTSDGRATTPASGARRGLGSQILRFAAVGVVSTLAWAGLFSLLRGVGLGGVAANGIALVVTAVGNTAANRRFTFGRTGRAGLDRDHGAGLFAFVIALAITSVAAAALGALAPHAARIVEIAVLSVASVLATAARFVLLRAWVGRPVQAPAG
jgi:putative flippase GtrA